MPRTRKTEVAEEAPARRKRGTAVAVASTEGALTPPAKKKRPSRVAAATSTALGFNPYQQLDGTLDKIEKEFGLTSSGIDPWEDRMSTGLLTTDLILSGGVVGGNWYTNFGPEQSTKTTGAVAALSSALISGVPIIYYFDYENSFQPEYFEAVVATLYRSRGLEPLTTEEMFGVQDNKGNWIKRGRIRMYQEAVAEKFFNTVAKLLKTLPEKKKIGDQWYYIYEDTKENRALCSGHYDKTYLSKTGKLRVVSGDSRAQAVILLDSYPAMLPELIDDKDEGGGGMASQARMFSDQIKRVKGRMRGRRVSILGINQVRQRPAVMMGNPEYEPCGDALKFYSDVRLRYNSRAISGVPYAMGKGQIEEEPSLDGKGKDTYRYIHVRAHKNKLSTPGFEGWLRVWISDRRGKAHGYCPVWDTFMYLIDTGQITSKNKSNRNTLHLKLKHYNVEKDKTINVNYDGSALDWMTFKRLILGTNAQVKELCESIGLKPIRLRKFCFQQMTTRMPDGTLFGVHLRFSHMYDEGEEVQEGEEDGDEHYEADDE